MKRMLVFLTIMLTFFCSGMVIGQNPTEDEIPDGPFTILINPSYYFLGGYHAKLSYHFPRRWSLGVTAQGGFRLPTFAKDQFFEIEDEETTVNWPYAIGLEIKYRFTSAPYDKGFFVTANLGYEEWRVENEEEDRFGNAFASLEAGYNWYPFNKERFHLGASYSLIFILNNTDVRSLQGSTYNIRPVVPPSWIPSLFVGWRF